MISGAGNSKMSCHNGAKLLQMVVMDRETSGTNDCMNPWNFKILGFGVFFKSKNHMTMPEDI